MKRLKSNDNLCYGVDEWKAATLIALVYTLGRFELSKQNDESFVEQNVLTATITVSHKSICLF